MSNTSRPIARRLLAAGLAVVLSASTVACGSDGGDDPSSGGAATTAAVGPTATTTPSDPAAYPVTIEHAFGSTTVEAFPERIALVGITDQDAAIALGVLPVLTVEWFGDHPGAIFPWAQEAAGALGDVDDIVVLEPDAGYPVETIAAARPDLIVGLYSSLTDDQYAALSKIAPTVAQPDGPGYGISWKDQILTMGDILGKRPRAEELVAETEAAITAAREASPELEGRTAVTVTSYEGIYVYGSTDPRGRVLQELGMVIPEEVDEVATGAGAGQLSLERADLLDLDAIVWLDPEEVQGTLGGPVYQALGKAEEGREVAVDGESDDGFGAALSFQSVLSLPFLVERLAPMLVAAVDGDPATPVAG